ncbi:hypothetical protein D9613_009164 [Agrocybe pediades]|uniref:Uncharacterized protein n=1 Tax=Agrocybe pediades TaxID=84607 RepID=A0A8H4VWD1_9AGAR|nr:hypothetical protein D9613_009164 [Agrocybe pediades]
MGQHYLEKPIQMDEHYSLFPESIPALFRHVNIAIYNFAASDMGIAWEGKMAYMFPPVHSGGKTIQSCGGTFIPGIVITIQEIESLIFKAVPLGGLGCNLVQSSRVIVAAYSLIGVSETATSVPELPRRTATRVSLDILHQSAAAH